MNTSRPALEFTLTVRIPASWPFLYLIATALRNVLHSMHQWPARIRNRRTLTRLDDHILKDIGISRDTVARECAKPFWRA